MAKKKHHKNNQGVAYMEVEKSFGMWENYMQYGFQYDTVNDCPLIPGETRRWNNYLLRNCPQTLENYFAQRWSIWYLTTGRKKD